LLAGFVFGALCVGKTAAQTEPRRNFFNDPFGPVTSGLPGCPVPEGPLLTEEEAKRETHWRAERGTSCYRSGRCRLPNAYRYDTEIFPRALQFVRQDGRFEGTSVWITVQRRWIFVQGCVRSSEEAAALEAALKLIDDVEAVVPQLMVGTTGTAPYATAGAPASR
jgi:hypothetical protein